eukprot:2389316-Amphidinium_carterae.1
MATGKRSGKVAQGNRNCISKQRLHKIAAFVLWLVSFLFAKLRNITNDKSTMHVHKLDVATFIWHASVKLQTKAVRGAS